ncbi:MAG: hypothetical protein H3C62_09390 [Gemmatimonadaceae bacterium]|nr:hypothetical protein [Gemmatimonadaceae bacterium]
MGLLVGFEPARLPAALLNVAAYKLTFLASLSLIAVGAAVARYVRRAEATTRQGEVTSTPEQTPGQIGAAQNPDAFVQTIRHREPYRV